MYLALVSAFAIGCAFWIAEARAADNPGCAKYEEPLAYNACLARSGPPAHNVRAIPEPEGDGKAGAPAEPQGRRTHGAVAAAHDGRGRQRLEFDVGPSKRRN